MKKCAPLGNRFNTGIYTTETKRQQLYNSYLQKTDSGEHDHPVEFDNSSSVKFIEWQTKEFDWPKDMQIEVSDTLNVREMYAEMYQPMVDQVVRYYRKRGLKQYYDGTESEVGDILAGTVNTGGFEASLVNLFGSGALILVNAGLQSMMWQCGKILVNGAIRESANSDTFYNLDTACDFLLQIVEHASKGDPRTAPRSHANSQNVMVLAGAIADASSKFIIGHETAHLTEADSDGTCVSELEYRADWLSMECLVHDYNSSISLELSNNEKVWQLVRLLAPILSMEIWHLKRCRYAIHPGSNLISYNAYPSDLSRRDNLVELLKERDIWNEVKARYERFSAIINAAYHLMFENFENTCSFRRDMLRIQEGSGDESLEAAICNSLTYGVDRRMAIESIAQQVEQRLEGARVRVEVNPDL